MEENQHWGGALWNKGVTPEGSLGPEDTGPVGRMMKWDSSSFNK